MLDVDGYGELLFLEHPLYRDAHPDDDCDVHPEERCESCAVVETPDGGRLLIWLCGGQTWVPSRQPYQVATRERFNDVAGRWLPDEVADAMEVELFGAAAMTLCQHKRQRVVYIGGKAYQYCVRCDIVTFGKDAGKPIAEIRAKSVSTPQNISGLSPRIETQPVETE